MFFVVLHSKGGNKPKIPLCVSRPPKLPVRDPASELPEHRLERDTSCVSAAVERRALLLMLGRLDHPFPTPNLQHLDNKSQLSPTPKSSDCAKTPCPREKIVI